MSGLDTENKKTIKEHIFTPFRGTISTSCYSYLHSLLSSLTSCLSESALHLDCLLGYGAQELFATTRLWVIFSKLEKKFKVRKHPQRKLSDFLSQSHVVTNQGRKGREGFFLMCHSTSVVTFTAHPLGQQVVAA